MSCDFCTDKNDSNRNNKFGAEEGIEYTTEDKTYNLKISLSHFVVLRIENDYTDCDEIEINFCPMCGRNLKESK